MKLQQKRTDSEWYEIVERKIGSTKWKCYVKFWQLWKVYTYPTLEAANRDLATIHRKPNKEYAVRHSIFNSITERGVEYFC